MRSLKEVEQARSVMTEAMNWSVMKWLREKKNVRRTADRANAALDELDRNVKARWSHDLTTAYNELLQPAKSAAKRDLKAGTASAAISADVRQFARQVKEADDQAYLAHMDAERTFDEAERLLSTSLAREGCRKAILSWDLHEQAIRRAER